MSHYFENDKNVKSNKKIIKVKLNNNLYSFFTDNGVFSKNGLDFGTRTLLESINIDSIMGTVLDVGCGYGPIGVIIGSNKKTDITMCDINERALNLAKENVKLNNIENVEALKSNIYENIEKKFDYIITNPPIRAGKEILYNFVFGAKQYLNKLGKLYFVINKEQGAKSLIKELNKIYNIEILNKNKGFFVICCKVIDND